MAHPGGAEPAAGADRPWRHRPAGRAGHQGVRAGRHGPARPGHRRHRLGQVGAAADAGARPGADAIPRSCSTSCWSTSRAARPSSAWSGCRHISAVITNLEEELPLVDRMRDALHGEMVRRQELLRAAGNYASLRDYERARERGAKLAPLPTLFIVLDEFSELLAAKPEFIDLFVMIGRLGRSLGVHLLLASQRLEEGRLRGLDTQLSYRIGLRTFSAAESRIVLGVPDAYELPSRPGNGYLKTEATEMTRFKAAYVSGPSAGEPRPPRAPWRRRGRSGRWSCRTAPGYVRPKVVLTRRRGPTAPADDGGQPCHAGPEPVRGRDPPARRARARRRTRSGCRRWTCRRRWTSCCRRCPSPRSTAARPTAGPGGASCTWSPGSSTGRSSSAGTRCGPTCPARRATSAWPARRAAASPPCCAR